MYNTNMKNIVDEALQKGIVKDEVNIEKQKKHLERFAKDDYRSYIFGDNKKAEILYNRLKGTGTAVLDKNGK